MAGIFTQLPIFEYVEGTKSRAELRVDTPQWGGMAV